MKQVVSRQWIICVVTSCNNDENKNISRNFNTLQISSYSKSQMRFLNAYKNALYSY